MGPSQANNLSGNLIPNVLGQLINKSNDRNDSSFSLKNYWHRLQVAEVTKSLRKAAD
jgi:hypothetical protein